MKAARDFYNFGARHLMPLLSWWLVWGSSKTPEECFDFIFKKHVNVRHSFLMAAAKQLSLTRMGCA